MQFYNLLSRYYDEIFPFSKSVYKFIENSTQKNNNILEIGSATGKYINEFNNNNFNAVGLEYNSIFMNYPHNLIIGDMHSLPFKKENFHRIFCIGNTLAHARDKKHLIKILKDSFSLLVSKGSMIIQTVNYDRIYAHNITSLPEIETENIVFRRYYEYNSEESLLFRGELTEKSVNKTYESSVNLVPVFFEDFIKASGNIGASLVNFNGSFEYDKLEKYSSFATIATFTKP